MNVEISDGVTTKVIHDRHGGSPVRVEIVQKTGYDPDGHLTDLWVWFYVSDDQSGLGGNAIPPTLADPPESFNARVAKSIAAALLPEITACRRAELELLQAKLHVGAR